MDKKQAYEIVKRICTNISATRQDHAIIDEALAAIKPEEVKKS